MAGSKGSKYYDVFLNYDVWLEKKGVGRILTEEHFKLLEAIDQEKSLQNAAIIQGISYRKAWGALKYLEKHLNFLIVESHRGGRERGSTELTGDGKDLLCAYHELRKSFDESTSRIVKKFFNKINSDES